jgi:hypothetical protein
MRALARWHRRIGLFAAALVVLVTLTGLVLQHAGALGLTRATITNRAIVSLYVGDRAAGGIGLRAGGRQHVWRAGVLYSADAPALLMSRQPIGAVPGETGLVIAAQDGLHLLDKTGALLEHVDVSLLPGPPAALGQTPDGAVVLRAEDRAYKANADFSVFQPHSGDGVAWSSVEALSAAAIPDFVARAEPLGLPLDRIILDLHTGRLFGAAGVWIVNIGSLAFLALALTGVVTALRRNGIGKER